LDSLPIFVATQGDADNGTPEPRTLAVIAKRHVTPNMLRVTLGGSGLADFPENQTSAYVKLRLPDDGCGK
jgi:NADPH-dependent ferric siderophore reductase